MWETVIKVVLEKVNIKYIVGFVVAFGFFFGVWQYENDCKQFEAIAQTSKEVRTVKEIVMEQKSIKKDVERMRQDNAKAMKEINGKFEILLKHALKR